MADRINDLGYRASLIAVSASSNRSKSDQEPQDWMPERAGFACKYVKRWAAVKWRWDLKVNATERRFLVEALQACGWPLVARPGLPNIPSGSSGSGGASGGSGSTGGGGSTRGGGSPGTDARYDYCYNAIDAGYGPYYRGSDSEYDWYTDSDSDGVVCES